MSVLIPGMEMPECCQDCTFCDFETDYEDGGYYVCHAIPKQIIPSSSERQEDCPLIPVPEHGDLIDRDKLEKDIERYIGGEESRSRFHHWVQVQSVVIPREKGEEK